MLLKTKSILFLQKLFRFDVAQHQSSIGTEVLAGVTTFGAMAYIIAVNPAILAVTGAGRADMITVTVLAAMCGSLLMAFLSRLPIALAPGMGSNAVFAQVVVVKMGMSYGTALTMVLVGGVLFTCLSLSNVRQHIVRGFPASIRIGLQAGIGLFIAYLGLKSGGLIVNDSSGSIAFADLRSPSVMVVFLSLLLIAALVAARVRGAMLLSILAVTVAGLFIQTTPGHFMTVLPSRAVALPHAPTAYFFAFDTTEFFKNFFLVLPLTLYFFLSDFFSATATMIAVTRRAGMMDEQGNFRNSRRAYLADGLASIVGACLGSPTVGAYVESATGVEAGGRTGLTTLTVAILFGLSAFLWPLIACIPPQATTAALVMVGVLMMEGLTELDVADPLQTISAGMIVLLTVTTANLMIGICAGCFAYTVMAAATRSWKRLPPVFLLTNVLLVIYLVLVTYTVN
ncbi:MAG: NCS2 family permease [Acetobacter sp.]